MLRTRKRLRLREYDYSNNGYYFVTICSHDRKNHFGEIRDRQMILNDYGHVVDRWWQELEKYYGHCRLDEYVIMPNHMHGIIEIHAPDPLAQPDHSLSLGGGTPPLRRWIGTLSDMMGYFKYQSTKRINEIRNSFGPVWQRGFHDHIIRNEHDLTRTREYIQINPSNWNTDENNVFK